MNISYKKCNKIFRKIILKNEYLEETKNDSNETMSINKIRNYSKDNKNRYIAGNSLLNKNVFKFPLNFKINYIFMNLIIIFVILFLRLYECNQKNFF